MSNTPSQGQRKEEGTFFFLSKGESSNRVKQRHYTKRLLDRIKRKRGTLEKNKKLKKV